MVTSSSIGSSVLERLSFNNNSTLHLEDVLFPNTTAMPPPSRSDNNYSNNDDMQGVLWKRRDVFKNRWRPRWFVLHPEQKILTYYLLVNNSSAPIISSSTSTSSSSPRGGGGGGAAATTSTNNRQRIDSETSDLSTSTTDYDVIPRGTIYIGGSQCSVDSNTILTRPSENLFALTISDKENATQCHLAARTPEARQRWIEQLRRVINNSSTSTSSLPSTITHHNNNNNNNRRQQRSIAGGVGGGGSFEPVHEETISSDTSNDHDDANDLHPLQSEEEPTPAITPTSRIGNDMPSSTTTSSAQQEWKTVPSSNLTDNVPTDLANEIDLIINRFFTKQKFHIKNNNPEWTFLSNKDGIHHSCHVDTPGMIRSIYNSKSNHPIDYLKFGWDVSRATEISSNIRFQKQIKSYNQHTCLVHAVYHRVWPTAAREFTSVAHWRLMENLSTKQRGICVVAFSCQQADELQPILPHHVRATLHASINFYLPVTGEEGCTGSSTIHTRAISFDLNGSIPKTIVQTLIQQQRGLPKVMDTHIAKTKTRTTTTTTKMEYDAIYPILNNEQQQTTTTTTTARAIPAAVPERSHENDDNIIIYDDKKAPPIPKKVVYDQRCDSIVTPPSMTLYWIEHPPFPSVWKETIRLLTPVAIYKLLWSVDFRYDYIIFLIALIFAIRWIVLQHLLQHYGLLPRVQHPLLRSSSASSKSKNQSTTLCQFSVDPQGVIRYLQEEEAANKNQHKGDGASGGPRINLEHVILRALAQAMAQQPGLVARKYPFLPPLYSLDVLIQDDEKLTAARRINSQLMTLHEIAMIESNSSSLESTTKLFSRTLPPACHVRFNDSSQNNSTTVLKHSEEGALIVVGISGLPVEKPAVGPNTTTTTTSSSSPTNDPLSVTISIQSSDVDACRKFAEQVRQAIQFQESE